MTKSTKNTLTVIVSIALATFLIGWALRGIDIDKTLDSLKNANFLWVFISAFLGILAYYIRAQRWRLLLEPMGNPTHPTHAFVAVCMTYFWNLLIPRSGEIARCTTLYTLNGTPVDKSLGTVISERVIDFICLLFVALLTLVLKFDLIIKLIDEILSARQSTGEKSYLAYYLVAALAALIALLFILLKKRIKKLPLYPKIRGFIYGLRQGLKTVFLLKQSRLFIFYTLAIWLLYFVMTYIVIWALPETTGLGLSDGLFLLLVGGVGMVIPASGGIGAYHGAMRIGFIVLGLSGELGLTFGFLVHTPHTLIALLLGLISFVIIYREKRKQNPLTD